MGVGGNRYHHARRGRPAGVLGRQVEPVRTRIDFDEAAILPRVIDDAFYLDLVAGTLEQQSARRVPENIEIPVVHGAQQTLRLRYFV